MNEPRMFYFGPWDRAGHYFFDEHGRSVWGENLAGFPFGHSSGKILVDGRLQPRGPKRYPGSTEKGPELPQGVAALHHMEGWTALCFWDRSVDERGACNSNYFAEGTFTFNQMVEMAKTRFAYRWSKMNFQVVPVPAEGLKKQQP